MKRNYLQQILKIKMAVADEVLQHMPQPLRRSMIEIQNTIMGGVMTLSKEYLEKRSAKSPDENCEKGLKAIAIE